MTNGESVTEEELEVADILINLPFSFKKSLTPNSDAVDAVNHKGEDQALSPNTPLSHSVALNLSDSNLNHSSKPSTKRKKSRSNKVIFSFYL